MTSTARWSAFSHLCVAVAAPGLFAISPREQTLCQGGGAPGRTVSRPSHRPRCTGDRPRHLSQVTHTYCIISQHNYQSVMAYLLMGRMHIGVLHSHWRVRWSTGSLVGTGALAVSRGFLSAMALTWIQRRCVVREVARADLPASGGQSRHWPSLEPLGHLSFVNLHADGRRDECARWH